MKNIRPFPDDGSTSERIASGLSRLSVALKAKAWKGAALDGITPTQGEALSCLSDAPDGMKLGDLAAKLGVSAPTASDAVSTLVTKGLILKTHGTDRRSILLKLTREGQKHATRTEGWTSFLSKAVDSLEAGEKAAFLQSLIKIIQRLQENGDIAPQRTCVTCEHFRPFAHQDAANPHHCAFIDAAFGSAQLRVNCAEHVPGQGIAAL